MATKVQVTPSQLQNAAGEMATIQGRVSAILTTLEDSLAARGSAWGDDSYGATFADGPAGYIAARKNLTEGMANVAKTLGSYSDGQRKAAKILAAQDHL